MKCRSLLIAVAAVPALPLPARAQSFPTRPVRMVIGFPPGGGSDQVGRPLAARMPDVLGHRRGASPSPRSSRPAGGPRRRTGGICAVTVS